jgi:hypothetical protein
VAWVDPESHNTSPHLHLCSSALQWLCKPRERSEHRHLQHRRVAGVLLTDTYCTPTNTPNMLLAPYTYTYSTHTDLSCCQLQYLYMQYLWAGLPGALRHFRVSQTMTNSQFMPQNNEQLCCKAPTAGKSPAIFLPLEDTNAHSLRAPCLSWCLTCFASPSKPPGRLSSLKCTQPPPILPRSNAFPLQLGAPVPFLP